MGSTTFTGGGLFSQLPCCRCRYLRVIGRGTGEEGLKAALTNSRVDAVYACWYDIVKGYINKNSLMFQPDKFIVMKRIKNDEGELEDVLWEKGRKLMEEWEGFCLNVDG